MKMQLCNDCPRKCNVTRADSNLGVCKMPRNLKLAKACLHYGEEPCISGKNGSGTIFFSGCSLKCVFCQNYEISHEGFGKEITAARLAEIFRELENNGANNINLVSATHYLSAVKEALNLYRPKIPLVYNSSGYEDIKTIEEDIFDVYLFDLKFFSREKSEKYAKCPDYFDISSNVIKKAYDIKGKPVLSREGIMQSGIIVRHLILPQSTNDAIAIIDWLSENTPGIYFSLMSQYLPMYKAEQFKELNRKITKREYEKVLAACADKNFEEIYIQSLDSATNEYIPDFDLTGV